MLGEDNEKQKQRPDVYLGLHQDLKYPDAGVRYVGGNKNFEINHLLGPDAEVQKQRPDIYAQTESDVHYEGQSEILKNHPEWAKEVLLSKDNEFQRQRPEKFDDSNVQLGVRFIDGSYE